MKTITGKFPERILITLIKYKASEFFQPLQFGVACASGSEKVVHGLRAYMDKHWEDDDFAVVKVDNRCPTRLPPGPPALCTGSTEDLKCH